MASERLLHIALDTEHYEQLAMAKYKLDRRRSSTPRTFVCPRTVSVACQAAVRGPQSLPMLVFPNVRHVQVHEIVALDLTEMCAHDWLATPLCLDSLLVSIQKLSRVQEAVDRGLTCQLLCLILNWGNVFDASYRSVIRNVLRLTPHLVQLAITGGIIEWPRDEHLEVQTSIFDHADVTLPQLTYLQFDGGLLSSDIEYLLPLSSSSTSAPEFAASLTHLALSVRWNDIAMATDRLSSLATLYPNLQRCHVRSHNQHPAFDATSGGRR